MEFWTSEAVLDEAGPGGPDEAGEDGPGAGSSRGALEHVLRMRLPLPYSLPPVLHGPGDTPWIVDGQHEGADALGRVVEEVFG